MNFSDNIVLFNSQRFKDRTIFFSVVLLDLSITNDIRDTPEATKQQRIHDHFYKMQMIGSLSLSSTLKQFNAGKISLNDSLTVNKDITKQIKLKWLR